MNEQTARAPGGALVTTIGATSLTLGAVMIGATDTVLETAGVRTSPRARLLLRGRGVTEIAQGLGALARRQPTQVLRSRVFGDLLDLGLLGAAAARDPADRRRLGAAAAAVAGIGVADLLATRRCAAASDRPASEGGRGSLAAITVLRPLEVVADRAAELDACGEVALTPAPGDRGTEVRVDVTGRGGLREDLFGRGRSRERALIALRRFKQRLETGEIVRSDGAPEGPTPKRQLLQRAGRPPA